MIAIILMCQIILQVIIHYEPPTETRVMLIIALAFCVAMAQARWCAMWVKFEEVNTRLEKLEEKKKTKGGKEDGNTG